MYKKSGFTIVELLIVIVVIAILAAISIVAYNGIQQRGRDTQRSSDIANIKKALEVYRIHNGGYPTCVSTVYQVNTSGNQTCRIDAITALRTSEYLGKAITDPINSGNNQYMYAVGFRNNTPACSTHDQSQNYIIGSRFESTGNVATYNCWSLELNYKTGSDN